MSDPDTGLAPEVLHRMVETMRREPEVERAILFGSRATGKFRPNSDIDIAVSGVTDPKQTDRIKRTLDEFPFPYKFDVVATDSITSRDLSDRIVREGVVFYERPPVAPDEI